MVIRGTPIQHRGAQALDVARQAAVEAGAEFVSPDAWSRVMKAGQANRPDGIVVADDGGRAFQPFGGGAHLPAVQQLAMREMDIGEADAFDGEELGEARRNAARQARTRQFDEIRRGDVVGRPGAEAVDPFRQRQEMKMAADHLGQFREVRLRFLHQQQIRPLGLDQGREMGQHGAAAMPEIPADDFQA